MNEREVSRCVGGREEGRRRKRGREGGLVRPHYQYRRGSREGSPPSY
jgi:hypothetical protein